MPNPIFDLVQQAEHAVGSLADSESSDFEQLSPMLSQSGGSERFAAKGDEDLLSDLDGKKDITGYLFGWRFQAIAYPLGWQNGIPADQQPKPVYGCAVPGLAGADSLAVKRATSAYQFTKVPQRDKFDFDKSQAGHIKPSIELLIYSPVLGDLVVLRSYNHYNAVFAKGRTVAQLEAIMADNEGKVPEVPMKFSGISSPGFGDKPVNWIGIEQVADKKAIAAWAEFSPDADTTEAAKKWLTCEDNPIDDNIRSYLVNCNSCNPQRF